MEQAQEGVEEEDMWMVEDQGLVLALVLVWVVGMVPMQLLEEEVEEAAEVSMVGLDTVKGLGQVRVLVTTVKEGTIVLAILLMLVVVVVVEEEDKQEVIGVLVVKGKVVVPVLVPVMPIGIRTMDQALQVQVQMEMVVEKAPVNMVEVVVVADLDLGMVMPTPRFYSPAPTINL
jgi:hypothetical protein